MSIQPIARIEPVWNHLHKERPNEPHTTIDIAEPEAGHAGDSVPVDCVFGRTLAGILARGKGTFDEFNRQYDAVYPCVRAAKLREQSSTCLACNTVTKDTDITWTIEDEPICPECGVKNSF